MGKRDTILIVDDVELNRTILSGLFQNDYHILEAENGEQALLLLKEYHSSVAIMLLDVVMPVKDGYQVLEEVGKSGRLNEVPVVVITADNSLEGELKAFDLGASDIITKPFEPHVVKRRVRNIIELYHHRHNLEEMVEDQAAKLRESNSVLVDALSSVIEYRSLESGQHIRRIRLLSRVLLEEVRISCPEYGLDEKKIDTIASAAALHDIGKIAIPDSILNKPGRLTAEEFEVMKTHTVKGCEILNSLNRISDKEYLQYAYNICRYHHERWGGAGYPDGLQGDAIPICAQVVGIVDAYDALTSDRVYKKAISHARAVNMILNGECGVFSPKLLECFKIVKGQLDSLIRKYADGKQALDEAEQTAAPVMPALEVGAGSLELEQMKYFAMLRFENAAVSEIDLSSDSYHLVYAPHSMLLSRFQGERLQEAAESYINNMVHPEDAEMAWRIWREELPRFFDEGRLQQSWNHRLFDLVGHSWRDCCLTALRIDTERPRQRKALLLWKTERTAQTGLREEVVEEDLVLQSILGGVFQCRNDRHYTFARVDSGFLGYSREELHTRFQDRFVELIYRDDRERVRKELSRQLNVGAYYELEYRVVNRDGEIHWVLNKGCRQRGKDGEELLYGVLIDIDQSKHAQEELRLSLERYKIILDQTNDIIFEWDVKADTVSYSANWEEKFGYKPIQTEASKRIPRVSHLYPEDMSAFGTFIKKMGSGTRYDELDFRVADGSGSYRWCRIRATAQFDDDGQPCRAVGTIVDINDERMATQELREQVEQDNLTKLYNKSAARHKIETFLAGKDDEVISALFIIDLDNFKLVNDQFGHMFGDAVLTKVAALLSQLFRSEDVVSRIGGDEFMVFIRGAQSVEQVEAVSARIIERFQGAFEDLPKECSVLCSIGIALSPRDGSDFQTLFQRADVALYQAKARGKNRFQIYDAATLSTFPAGRRGIANTRIDSDERSGMDLSNMIPAAFRILNNASDMEQGVEAVLEMVGRQVNVSRTYVFENSQDGLRFSNTFEWCNNGVSSEKDEFQDVSYSILSSDYQSFFDERGVFYCPDVAQLPEDLRAILEPRGIKAILQCAIREAGVFRGWVGFDECETRHLWTQDQIDVLVFAAELLSLFLLRHRVQKQLQA